MYGCLLSFPIERVEWKQSSINPEMPWKQFSEEENECILEAKQFFSLFCFLKSFILCIDGRGQIFRGKDGGFLNGVRDNCFLWPVRNWVLKDTKFNGSDYSKSSVQIHHQILLLRVNCKKWRGKGEDGHDEKSSVRIHYKFLIYFRSYNSIY